MEIKLGISMSILGLRSLFANWIKYMKFLNFEEYKTDATKAFDSLSEKLRSILPNAQVEHIGSSAIEGAISKGDLDIFVGVSKDDFDASLEKLETHGFVIKESTFRSPELCMLECFDFNIDVGIQLVDLSSRHTDFLGFRDHLKNDGSLLKEYNALKLSCRGKSPEKYRNLKSKFICKVLGKSPDDKF